MKEIARRLQQISTANGNSFDAVVQRPKWADEELSQDGGYIVLIESGPTKSDDRSGTGQGFVRLRHRVQIMAYLSAPQDATESIYTTRARVHGEVIRALDLDPNSPSRYFGGLADQVEFLSAEPPDEAASSNPACHISIEFEVRVRQNDHALQ